MQLQVKLLKAAIYLNPFLLETATVSQSCATDGATTPAFSNRRHFINITLIHTNEMRGAMGHLWLYLSGPVTRLNAMLPQAGQTAGIRRAVYIPVRCGTTVYDPLQQQRTKKGALTTAKRGVRRVVVPAWPRASWARHDASCRLDHGRLEGFLAHRWRWQHCLSSTRQSRARGEQ